MGAKIQKESEKQVDKSGKFLFCMIFKLKISIAA